MARRFIFVEHSTWSVLLIASQPVLREGGDIEHEDALFAYVARADAIVAE